VPTSESKGVAGFPERLAEARRLRGLELKKDLSQAEVGRAMEVKRATANGWEAGTGQPPAATMEKLAKYLNVNPAWLILGVGPMKGEEFPQLAPQETRELDIEKAEKKYPQRKPRLGKRGGGRSTKRGGSGG
jgi:transcriptional regulator with XRE-family HTH domain